MKFFVDTAEVAEIRELNALGLVDGVTTNPSLVKKSGRDFIEMIREICGEVEGPVSAADGHVTAAMHVNDWDAIDPMRELVEAAGTL